jgi:hypothetical protein
VGDNGRMTITEEGETSLQSVSPGCGGHGTDEDLEGSNWERMGEWPSGKCVYHQDKDAWITIYI